MSSIDPNITVRDYLPGDKSFIMATFLRGLYYGNSWFSSIPKDIFMDNYKHAIEKLIQSDRTLVKVACHKDDADVIVGYSILSSDYTTVHWCHVRKLRRKLGIARMLLPKFPNEVTHLTELGRSLLPKLPNCVFNPFKV